MPSIVILAAEVNDATQELVSARSEVAGAMAKDTYIARLDRL